MDQADDQRAGVVLKMLFHNIRKTLNPLWIKRFYNGGISRARTYDLHDVNDKKTLILQQKMVGFWLGCLFRCQE